MNRIPEVGCEWAVREKVRIGLLALVLAEEAIGWLVMVDRVPRLGQQNETAVCKAPHE
jgi:hypothetical protein